MEFRKTLAEVLEYEIILNSRNIKQFSEKYNIPYMTISGVLKRGVENSNFGTIIKICKALELSVTDLYRMQAIDTLHYRYMTLLPENYSNIDIFNDLLDSGLIDKRMYTVDEQREIVKEYLPIIQHWSGIP